MYAKDINKYKWNISPSLKIETVRGGFTSKLEQELHISAMRCSLKDESIPEILVDCSDQTYITELSKCEFFTLNRIITSTIHNTEGYIVHIQGTLEEKGITIRKKKHEFTEEQKQRMRELHKKRKL